MSVYVDTSAFYAIVDTADVVHRQALRAWQRLVDGDEVIVTCNYLAVEAASLIHSRHGLEAMRRFVDEILSVVLIEWVDPAVHTAAMSAVLSSSSRQGPSLVDCVSFEIIRRSRINRVFAYDRHFEGRGFELLGRQ